MNNSDTLLQAFREELLRWNRQINLVSRQETDDRLDGLIKQCIGGYEAVDQWIDRAGLEEVAKNELYYFDLGSGGGLPGLVWHILFSESFQGIRSSMVEPREKRAWFLDRQNRIPNMLKFETLHGRWGDVSVDDDSSVSSLDVGGLIVVSLKALHLDDPAVLGGINFAFASLPGFLVGKTVLLARFYPPEQSFDEELNTLLSLPEAGHPVAVDDYIYRAKECSVVPLGKTGLGLATLVLSSYLIEGS